MTDDEFLDAYQRAAFDYFVEHASAQNGLVPDTTRDNVPCSIACVGFALSAYTVGVGRGWMTRAEAVQRTLNALNFFAASEQSDQPTATGYKGFYYHFLDMKTGKRTWECELSFIDTALLLAGMLTAAAYFDGDTPDERRVRELTDELYRRMDWAWAQNNGPTLSQGWKPEFGFMHRGWEGYNEAALMYVLGLASPTHPLTPTAYEAWTLTYQWENIYGHDVLYAGPLFIHQFSHAWIDFRELRDEFMLEKNFDYFKNSRSATYIQRIYAEHNPYSFVGYNSDCWGISAGDGPSGLLLNIEGQDRRSFSYAARGVPYGPDDGTIAPATTFASLPFAPEIVLPAMRYMSETYPEAFGNNRITGGFNPTALTADGKPWVSPGYYGLDQGILVMMIENYRSDMFWKLMRKCGPLRDGLIKAGFNGGWLEDK